MTTVTETAEMCKRILLARRVPMLHGNAGVAKSSIAKLIADTLNLHLIDVRLSTYDPVFLTGIPDTGTTQGKVDFRPLKVFPLEGDPIPEGKRGFLLFLDELSSCAPATMAAAYRLVLDREHGDRKLHPACAIMAAGNMVTSGAVAYKMPTAMATRLIHIEVDIEYKEWLNWANKEGLDTRVISYIGSKPDHLHCHTTKAIYTYRCPRTWHMLSDVIKGHELSHKDKHIVEGTIGLEGALDFIGFSQVFQDVPTVKDILLNPESVAFRDVPNVCYAISGVIAAHMTPKNAEPFIKFMSRMPIEFQAMAMRMVIHKYPDITEADSVSEWLLNNHNKLY